MASWWKMCVLLLLGVALSLGCSPASSNNNDAGDDAGDDADASSNDDADTELDADVVSDADSDADQYEPRPWCPEASYIWIANTAEGTLSMLCTLNGEEIGRYYTSPQEAAGDPSRTSVNLHGDAVVTNRDPDYGPSSVTKFASELVDCIDRNGNGRIDTSTGGDDVRPWGEDECMLWNSELPGGGSIGARATAWDGHEDETTGLGGSVWIGALTTGGVFQLDGDTGEIIAQTRVGNSPYGGAMDGRGHFWIVGGTCTIGICNLVRVNTETLESEPFNVPCGYGISVDAYGRIWTSGRTLTGSCVNRLDQNTRENTTLNFGGMNNFFRGLAVDNLGSVWVADTNGDVLQIDEETVELVNRFPAGPAEVVGIAIDYQDQVWAISQGGNSALRIDPRTYEVQPFRVGLGPYTYSDMTGYQLRSVIY